MEGMNNMEHILQIAIGIDDDAIVKRIEENAEKNITKELRDKVGGIMFGANTYSGKELDTFSRWTEGLFVKYLDDHKEEIIELAAKYLAEKLARTKAVREMTQDVAKGEAEP